MMSVTSQNDQDSGDGDMEFSEQFQCVKSNPDSCLLCQFWFYSFFKSGFLKRHMLRVRGWVAQSFYPVRVFFYLTLLFDQLDRSQSHLNILENSYLLIKKFL